MARRRCVHDPPAVEGAQGRERPRPVRRGRQERGPRRRGEADPARREGAARGPRVRPVEGPRPGADLHQLGEGVAAEHPRRLLDLPPLDRPAREARRRCQALDADVRQAFARWHPRRVRSREQPVRRAGCGRPGRRAHGGRLGAGHQRHLRLGVRGGVLLPRRLAVESRRQAGRVLAARHPRREDVHSDRQHERSLPGPEDVRVPQDRRAELGVPGRAWSPRPAARRRGSTFRATPAPTSTSRVWIGPGTRTNSYSSASTGSRTRWTWCSPTPTTGKVRTVLTERDGAWVDVHDDAVRVGRERERLHLDQRAGRLAAPVPRVAGREERAPRHERRVRRDPGRPHRRASRDTPTSSRRRRTRPSTTSTVPR